MVSSHKGTLFGDASFWLVNLSPPGIREHLHLNRPIYSVISAYGQFGRTPDPEKGSLTWNKTDLVDELRRTFGC